MTGTVLAGGTGSWLHPLMAATNKHLLPVRDYPTVFHSVARPKQGGITDVNDACIAAGDCARAFLKGWRADAGTLPSFRRAADPAARCRRKPGEESSTHE